MEWYIAVLKKYVEFSGRTRRKEYWMFFLFNFIVAFLLIFVEGLMGGPGIVYGLYSLAVLLPSLAVGVRRLHDTGKTGWWMLIGLIPIIGAIVLLIFFVQDGNEADNKWGANPKTVAA